MSTVAADTGVPRRRPRQRLWLALLAVSAALNLCFVAGAVWTRLQPPAEAAGIVQRYQRIASDLDLDAGQRAAFDSFVASIRGRSQSMHQQVSGIMGGAWEEVVKPNADKDKILRLLDEAADVRQAFVHDAAGQTLDFLSTLSPAQRSKFVSLARERRPRWWQSRSPNR